MHIETFHDPVTATFTYVVVDTRTKKCAVIDAVLDYDPNAGRASTASADRVIAYIRREGLSNAWILETHIHADHITAASYLKQHIGGATAIGSGIRTVLAMWVPKFDTAADTPLGGEQFERLFEDGDCFTIGTLAVTVWHTPGHTPACVCYQVEDAIFVGDTIFAPHLGTARCDFPGGSARQMYDSIQRIYRLPDSTRIFLCHDYPAPGKAPVHCLTVGEQKQQNSMIRPETTAEEYAAKREARDRTLAVPRLLYPSIQTNMRLGDFGARAANGLHYIRIPVNAL